MSDLYNPRDMAVALHYDGKRAPRVVATGRGKLAEDIIQLAEQHQVPLHTSPDLVRILANVPVETEIPRGLYLAVAEVIAFAYYIQGKHPDDVRQK
ncbi:MAG: hypothetical protein RIQ52_1985 [Pseudomonadota bacterium]|jgi:flagellar biosynthesis protein